MENFDENYLKNENEQNIQDNEDIQEENDEKKSKILFNEIIDDLIRKKTSKENMLKIQIEQNKKNLLEKFYSLSNTQLSPSPNPQPSLQSQFPNQNKDQKNLVSIPNAINPLMQEGQKEYDELREKYKNERNKKKSSIFKSEDLHISNTNSVHLKKEDYSPINPNMVNQETKNNILIIQKKLFGDNEETSKVENIDEIDDLDFEDIDIKDFKNNNNVNNNDNNFNENNIININNENDNINNNTNNNNKTINSNFNLANLDTNNINFDLSSNIKSEIMNDNTINLNEIEANFFPNEILKETRAVEYTYFAIKKKIEKIKDYKKQINRTKNFSVQLVSKLDYYREEDKDIIKNNNNLNNLNKYKKRKTGSENREVMTDMNDFIKNLNLMNPNMNNNININNINNNININHANLAEIISQQHKLNPKKIITNNKKTKMNHINNNIKNSKKNSDHYINLNSNINNINNINYNTNTATTSNTTTNKTNNISSSKKNNYSPNINSINNNPIISSKTPSSILNQKNKPSYKKVVLNNSKPILNNLDLNLNENIPNLQKVKTKAQIKINYRHISNANLTQINSSSNNNSNKRKRKNNSVIINNSNKRKDSKIDFYHFNTNTNNSNNNNINPNNIKNMINQIPSLYKNNPLTTKNKKISVVNIINSKKNNLMNNNKHIKEKKKSYNNINIITGNKFSTLNTIQKNNLIKFYRPNHQTEAINKLKQQTYLGIYFIYAEKIKDKFLFKGIYKKGVSDMNYICNKVYSGTSAPISINYEKFFIFIENDKMELIQTKLSSISVFNLNKSIILVKND